MERIQKYGNIVESFGENLSFGCDTAEEVVLQLIVDDGVANRGHRENIFKPAFKVIGIAGGQHAKFHHMVCMEFAGDFTQGEAKSAPAGGSTGGSVSSGGGDIQAKM
mmetsp:Transcript_27147/g.26191  ORF Transcript_27147/g.26191 Transcript_27147/m.26191 type:complete len:107 (-) Transcript_27147:169-489(-)|eukprot:CAMPEP_0170560080 /NCGR_PEP_ID=MMETSP0211-20121228/46923_1 /TAXON_ID=311385 /ORGANISM="Pseudokeronopsis sp., Strain OXSARD2" /LENGTH=106 /DNA_ID=CAMNT_0010873879 /DNA_START=237 /DNA_END=557 /DNA_ORIENTATION=+